MFFCVPHHDSPRSQCFVLFWCLCVLSHVRLFLTPWTVGPMDPDHQAPLSMGLFRLEY